MAAADEATTHQGDIWPITDIALRWGSVGEVDGDDPIFDAARAAYPDLDAWLARVRREGRLALLATERARLIGIAIVKITGETLKISTLAVAPPARGQGLGRRLVEEVVAYAERNGIGHIYATAYPDQALLRTFTSAGFAPDDLLASGELVYSRPFDRYGCVAVFHAYHRLPHATEPGLAIEEIRRRLVAEEIGEAIEAIEEGDLAHAMIELADVLYVSLGSAVSWAVPMASEPHRAPVAGPPAIRDAPGARRRLLAANGALDAALDRHDLDASVNAIRGILRTADDIAASFGLPIDPFFAEVARANLEKTATNLAGGKLSKPPGWRAPDADARLADLLMRRAA
jgi:GNAT superfamily N-acetyltransferase/predicted HAD superfamily Cof-like phosphohydrolase